ncbi:MAG: hypothetical protein L3J36_07445 [Rhodobacteraceae bacterium]|nr:hypothetical protein [Paracoccaceae bacterium]
MGDLTLLRDVQPDGYPAGSGDEARETTRALAREEGNAGFSSGANVAAALRLLAGSEAGKCVAVVICDSGLK